MRAAWNPSGPLAGELDDAPAIGKIVAPIVVAAAVLSNFVLCFINTNIFETSPSVVIAVEIGLIGMALALTWDCGIRLYELLLTMAGYFIALMALRSEFDPKIVRDCLIPVAFFFLGRYYGSCGTADRLVAILITVILGVDLFEWLAPGAYVHYFDVIRYYIARGTATETANDLAGGFFNSTRYSNRTLLPFLGEHRVSGIFLEAPSVGNFGAIAFAWVLLRDRHRAWPFIIKSAALAVIVVLADARFGLEFCAFTVLLYMATTAIRPTMLFVAPFVLMVALLTYAGLHWQDTWDNTFSGRVLLAGNILAGLDLSQVFGLQASSAVSGAGFAADAVNDSGYAYVLISIGLVGMTAMWSLFVYAPVHNEDAWRFKNFVALYFIVLLAISASIFTIKTAALLWFLYGTVNSPDRTGSGEEISRNVVAMSAG